VAKKCLAYLRVSGLSQVKGDGFPRQAASIAKYAKDNKLTVVETFKDKGVSGTLAWHDRPGLSSLVDRLMLNGIKIVLVEQADRLARGLVVGENILELCSDLGVRVIEAESGSYMTVDGGDPTLILIRQIKGGLTQHNKTVLVRRLQAARARCRKTVPGWREGRKPFGELPGEAETLDQIRLLRRKPRGGDRRSLAEIAAALNTAGMSSRTGRPWNRGTVFAICKRLGW